LGFAIPINDARDIAEQLIANGKVEHPFLGIRMASLTPEIKEQLKSEYNLDTDAEAGVLIVDVVPNSPAARAGLRRGDVISTIGNQDVTLPKEVQKIVSETTVGDEVSVQVIRQNKNQDLAVTVGILPNS
jgi:S1-C subfamily serine protease